MNKLLCALLIGFLLGGIAFARDDEEKSPPTFKPGAEVTIELTLKAPKDWQINYLLPLRVIFDKKALKEAPFTVESDSFSFALKEYQPESTVNIPVRLKDTLAPGELAVPFKLDYSICDKAADQCVFDLMEIEVEIVVENSAPADSKNRALESGSLTSSVQLPPAQM